jgi:hypothetical protein
MTRKERKGMTGPRLAVGAVVLLAVAIPLWIVIFVMPSPIGGLTPASGAFVKTPNVELKATVPE